MTRNTFFFMEEIRHIHSLLKFLSSSKFPTVLHLLQYYISYSTTSPTVLHLIQYYISYTSKFPTLLHLLRYYISYNTTSPTVLHIHLDHSTLPLASLILHFLLAVAATNSRDEPSQIVACSVSNVNWQRTAPAPSFSVEREWVSDSVSEWMSEWVSQSPCLSPSLLMLPNFCPSISHRAH